MSLDPARQLLEIEAIKQLKARYARAVDTKDWALLSQVLAEDARSVYGDGAFAFEGRDAIVDFLKGILDSREMVTMHQSHTPEIELTSETTARGTWYLEDIVFNVGEANEHNPARSAMVGTGIYHDEYVKRDDAWQISLTGYERIFEYRAPMHADGVMRTRWNR